MYGLHAELNVLYINIEHIKTYTCMPILTDKTIIISYLLVSGEMYLRPPVIILFLMCMLYIMHTMYFTILNNPMQTEHR